MQDKLSNGFSGNGKRTMNLKWTKKKKKTILLPHFRSPPHTTAMQGKVKKKNLKKV